MRTLIGTIFSLIGSAACLGWAWLPDNLTYKVKPVQSIEYTPFLNHWAYPAVLVLIWCCAFTFYKLGTWVYDYIKSN